MDFLDPSHRAWIQPHKGALISWEGNKLVVHYKKELHQTSAGFRVESQLEPNQTYQLEISAKLVEGTPAFVYVEDTQQQRLVPRIKIYQNTEQPYQLKHNFITLPVVNLVYLGVLFYYPDQDYKLVVDKFSIRKVEKLTQANLLSLNDIPQQVNPSDLASTHSILEATPSLATNTTAMRPVSSMMPQRQAVIAEPSEPEATNITYPSMSDLHSSWLEAEPGRRRVAPLPVFTVDGESDLTSSLPPEPPKAATRRGQPRRTPKTTAPTTLKNQNHEVDRQSWGDSMSQMWGNRSELSEMDRETAVDLEPIPEAWGGEMEQIARNPIKSQSPFGVATPQFYSRVSDMLSERENQAVLPLRVTHSLLEKLKHFLKQQNRKLIVSLTTTPTRVGKVKKVVDSLLAQSLPIHTLYLIIPDRYKRNNKPYLIHKSWYFKSDPRVKIVRTADVGPMTKLHPILDLVGNDTIILTADDDHIYPRHWAVYLSYLAITKPTFKGVYSFKGYVSHKPITSQSVLQPVNLDWFCGEWGVAIPRKWIKNEAKMLKQISFSQDAFFSDDVLISNHLAASKIARILLPRIRMPHVYPKATEWSNSYDSLHKMNPPQGIRYMKVLQTLQERRYYYLDRMGPSFKVAPTAQPDGTPIEEEIPTVALPKEPVLQPLDPHITFQNKRIRYISYLTDVYHPENMLAYLKYLPNATLELPKVDVQHVSLPQDYAPWYRPAESYEIIMVDLPYCLDRSQIQIKSSGKDVYYIYRYPEIGDWKNLPQYVIMNQKSYGGHYLWRPDLDLQVKSTNLRWDNKLKHLTLIITHEHYLANLDMLFDFWNNHCQDLKIVLHIGAVMPLSEKIQALVNELKIRNIRVYNQSQVFATLVYHCDYYFNPGFFCDYYAHWANKQHKTLIMMKYGAFENFQNIIQIPFELGKMKICREYLFESHQQCVGERNCTYYGHREAEHVPIINQSGLHNLFYQLFAPQEE